MSMATAVFDNFRGGKSEESDRGLAGAYKHGINLDPRKFENTLSCQQKMTKDSGSIVVDLIKSVIVGSDGNQYHFGDTGKIYRRTSGGTWSVLATDADGAISGAAEWHGRFYYATATKLKYTTVAAPNFAAPTTLSTGLTTGYNHPMKAIGGYLLIGNKDVVSGVSIADAFTLTLSIVTPDCVIESMDDKDGYAVMSCRKLDNQNESYLFLIDPNIFGTTGSTWLKRFRIPTRNMTSMITSDTIYSFANGGLYYADFANVIPVEYVSSASVNGYGMATLNALVLAGLKGNTYPGIWTYGKIRKNQNSVWNYEYTLSPDVAQITADPFTTTISDIGAVWTDGDKVFASWKSGSTYGVDVVDTSNKAVAVYESLEMKMPAQKEGHTIVALIKMIMKPLPASCSIALKYKLDKQSTWQTAKTMNGSTSFSTQDAIEAYWQIQGSPRYCYELRIELTPSANTTPEILRVEHYIDLPNQK